MTLADRLSLLTMFDATAVALFILTWNLIGWRIEHPAEQRPSVTALMSDYRRDWMKAFVTREPRIFDAQILASLRQGTAFFASSSLIGLGGLLALAGNTAPLQGVAMELAEGEFPALIWQLKLGLVGLCLTNAFLKFVWSNRLFGYCAVVMSAVPNEANDPTAQPRAAQAAELNIRAALNFNRGLRSIYFALASLAWLVGPVPLLVGTAVTIWLLWSREFASIPRAILLGEHMPTKR
ncbi:DUF599 domain-containing protein [Actibacterium sp. 188UL27-1]|uniref:DUF599 domain-containing protein n=1 Tax=Actibacterium sp. 188UL27-1 TaxID=2786961 RepID=UPI0019598047|nr:DUF599 domain-containing protein [Actibacterium sp. 188UL27-1]MBM7066272.1 DUF599 domain-containing protein [Actibacterium sp. 188UL27-1]